MGASVCARSASGRGAAPSNALLTAADLPKGAAPEALVFPHFPTRAHAFVWRNWQLVAPERMAEVLGARKRDILALGRAMGLGQPPRITRDQQRRSYLTVIRRNWHLLPYEQLLTLLGWSAEEMAYTLREDDFFYIKLGSLKPRCAPLRWTPADDVARRRETEMAALMRAVFPAGPATMEEPLFAFVGQLSAAPPDRPAAPAAEPLRYCYSYFALYGDPLLERECDPFPEGYLGRLAACGVNGVWLQGVLHKLAPHPWQPSLSARWRERLENLGRLAARARRQGLKVFLYLNEPRAMPLRFFESRPELKGVVEGDHATLCTSVPAVQQFLVESVAAICRAVPDLGGFFTITGSENLTHCWSHHAGAGCPRCGKRPPADVVAEANRLIQEGISRGVGDGRRERPRLIAWDWGWNDDWTESIVRQLPAEVALMSVSEWSLPIERGGVKSQVGEYSISAVGPGPRARRHWELGRKRGLRTLAKVQAGNTWELSTTPYIPAVANVARHAAALREAGLDGLMLSWTLGGYPSPNLEAVAEAMSGGSAEQALQRVSQRRFGPRLGPPVAAAWEEFSRAFSELPYHGAVLYNGPQQMGPANLLHADPTGYRATMTGFPYDDLAGWRGVYPAGIFAGQLEKVADGFDAALARLRKSVESPGAAVEPAHRRALDAEIRVAEAASIHFRSSACQARFVGARDALRASKTPEEARPHLQALEGLVQTELELARRLHALQTRDSRFGFEASNQYFFVPVDLAEKVLNCRDLLDRWLPAQRRRWGG